MEEKEQITFGFLLFLVIFLLTLGVLVYYIRFATAITPKASSFNTVNTVSITNSYIFASPVRAKANGRLNSCNSLFYWTMRVRAFLTKSQS